MTFLAEFLDVLLELAPWLLLGFAIAGLLHSLVPERWLVRALGGEGPTAVARAAVIGLPLPLCSCGVVPVAAGLRRQGAGAGPTAAFLVATPETGVDSVSATAATMHPVFVVLRPVAAILTALITGLWIALGVRRTEDATPAGSGGGSCCHHQAPDHGKGAKGLVDGMRYAFDDLLGEVAVYLLPALLITALATTWLPEGSLAGELGPVWLQVLGILVLSAPVYVCATATTPVAAAMLASGIAPAAVVVFLLAGPATNLLTMAAVRQLLGNRALGIYLLSVAGCSVLAGFATEWVLTALQVPVGELARVGAGVQHDHSAPWWRWTAAVALAALMAWHLGRRIKHRFTRLGSDPTQATGSSGTRA